MVLRTRAMMVVFATLIGVTLWSFTLLPTGFLPTEDQGYIICGIQLPDGASLARTTAAIKAQLAIDPRLSALEINVDTTDGRVTLAGRQGTVTVVLDAQGVAVSGLQGERRLDRLEPEALRREQLVIGRSTVVRDARALLDRLDLRLTTATGSSLLLTKILLGAIVGDGAAINGYRSAITARVTAPRIVKASYQKSDGGGPGGCWDEYEAYLLRIWNDFWESTQDYNVEVQDPALFLANARDTILRFRNHPSIVIWCGRNEGVPQPILNEGLIDLTNSLDGTRYYSPTSNQVNLQNSGPYSYTDPTLYFTMLNHGFSVDSTRRGAR
jgi:hypothetical protein